MCLQEYVAFYLLLSCHHAEPKAQIVAASDYWKSFAFRAVYLPLLSARSLAPIGGAGSHPLFCVVFTDWRDAEGI